MSKSTKHLTLLVGGMAILALMLAAVFPVLAQDGSPVVLQSGDTLGSLFGRYNLSDLQVRELLLANSGLQLTPGQTVTFPQGVIVDTTAGGAAGGDAGGVVAATGTPEAGTDAGGNIAATGTPESGVDAGATGAGAIATGTPDAGTDAGGAVSATGTPEATMDAGAAVDGFMCSNLGVTGGETYVTQEGDTLGDIFAMFGLDTGAGMDATVTDDQVLDFVNLNCDLTFVDGQNFSVPVGIPQTGVAGQAGDTTTTPQATTDVEGGALTTQTPQATTDVEGGALATQTPEATADADLGAVQATQTPEADDQGDQAGDTTSYTLLEGETLEDIANRFGITVERLIRLNPDLFPAGTVINVPSQQGSVPQTGEEQEPDLNVTEGLTLGQLVARYNLSQQNLRSFFNDNGGLTVAEGQTVQVPQGRTLAEGVVGGTDEGTYVTQAGDTLGDLFDNLGFDLTLTGEDGTDVGGTDAQLQEFVTLNSGLVLNSGQTVTLSDELAGAQGGQIPQTGAQLSPWGGSPDVPGLNLELDYDAVGSGEGVYVVQNGDSLSSIARQFNVDVAALWAMNPSVENPNVIYRGQRLRIPAVGEIIPGNGIFTQEQLENQFVVPEPSR